MRRPNAKTFFFFILLFSALNVAGSEMDGRLRRAGAETDVFLTFSNKNFPSEESICDLSVGRKKVLRKKNFECLITDSRFKSSNQMLEPARELMNSAVKNGFSEVWKSLESKIDLIRIIEFSKKIEVLHIPAVVEASFRRSTAVSIKFDSKFFLILPMPAFEIMPPGPIGVLVKKTLLVHEIFRLAGIPDDRFAQSILVAMAAISHRIAEFDASFTDIDLDLSRMTRKLLEDVDQLSWIESLVLFELKNSDPARIRQLKTRHLDERKPNAKITRRVVIDLAKKIQKDGLFKLRRRSVVSEEGASFNDSGEVQGGATVVGGGGEYSIVFFKIDLIFWLLTPNVYPEKNKFELISNVLYLPALVVSEPRCKVQGNPPKELIKEIARRCFSPSLKGNSALFLVPELFPGNGFLSSPFSYEAAITALARIVHFKRARNEKF